MTWPSVIRTARLPLATALAVGTAASFLPNLIVLLLPLGLLVVGAWALITGSRAFRAGWNRSWRQSAMAGLALVIALPMALITVRAGDYVHLALKYPVYAWKVRQAESQPVDQVSFSWGGTATFVGSGSSMRVLVYDVNGAMAHEVGVKPDPEEPGLSLATTHLVGRFYLVELIM